MSLCSFEPTKMPRKTHSRFSTLLLFSDLLLYFRIIFVVGGLLPFMLSATLSASIDASPFNSTRAHLDILQDVVKAISIRERWDLKDVRVLKIDYDKVRFGTARSYEMRFGFGKSHLLFKLSDRVESWRKFKIPSFDLGSLAERAGSLALLDTFKLEGPFELQVADAHRLSLSLPMNAPLIGLKRVLAGEGIALEVSGAREISLFYSSNLGFPMNRSTSSRHRNDYWPITESMCRQLLPIRLLGPASLVAAYKNCKPGASIKSRFISDDTIELLPDKCYRGHIPRKPPCLIDAVALRIRLLERILRGLLSQRIRQNNLTRFVKANIKASAAIKFQIELEKNVSVSLKSSLAEWRTRPTVERACFKILARIDAKRVKHFVVKKIKPLMESDSISWSNLMSNMSFTKLRSVLVPPEALTLDVKW